MGNQYFVTPQGPFHNTSGTAYNTSTTLTDVTPNPQITIPGLAFGIGSEIELWAAGSFSNVAASTPTLVLGLYYGGIAGVALAASSAVTTTTNAVAWPWIMRYRGVVRSIGTSGSIVGQGTLMLGTALTAFTVRPIPETAAGRTVTIDTTVAKTITVGAQWGTSAAGNTLTCDDLSVKLVN